MVHSSQISYEYETFWNDKYKEMMVELENDIITPINDDRNSFVSYHSTMFFLEKKIQDPCLNPQEVYVKFD